LEIISHLNYVINSDSLIYDPQERSITFSICH